MSLSGAGIQMGITIYLSFKLGEWLDLKFEQNYIATTLTLVGVFLSIYYLIRQVKKISEDD